LFLVVLHGLATDHDRLPDKGQEGYPDPGKTVERVDEFQLGNICFNPGSTFIRKIALTVEDEGLVFLPVDVGADHTPPNEVFPVSFLVIRVCGYVQDPVTACLEERQECLVLGFPGKDDQAFLLPEHMRNLCVDFLSAAGVEKRKEKEDLIGFVQWILIGPCPSQQNKGPDQDILQFSFQQV
jgi:hypothetical protein